MIDQEVSVTGLQQDRFQYLVTFRLAGAEVAVVEEQVEDGHPFFQRIVFDCDLICIRRGQIKLLQ
ncbi:hypothetical protein D9M68_870190 [compost metagenome]